MPYFVINDCDDDGAYIEQMSKTELLQRLKIRPDQEAYYGENPTFLSEIEHNNISYWGSDFLIIKGEIVTPRVVKVIEKFEI